MQDIAKRLGITKMTVSRFLNNPSNVAKATGSKIQEAVDDLGFVPSRVPAMLSQDSSKAIGVVIPSFSNMVFADVIQGIETEAKIHDYTVLITHTGYNLNEEERQIAELISYQVDGIILTEPHHSALSRRRLAAMDIPCVETMSLPEDPIRHVVGLDHAEVMYRCTKALLSSGRRLPVYLGVRLDIRTMQRQQGYERAMREFGYQPFALDSEERSNFTLAGELMRKALDMQPQLDAVLATNDDIAVGAMLFCQAQGLSIPERISILGYNGLNIGSATIPTLCSICTPRFEIGRQAARILFDDFEAQRKLNSANDGKTTAAANADQVLAGKAPEKITLPYSISDGQSVTPAELAALKQSACTYAAECNSQNNDGNMSGNTIDTTVQSKQLYAVKQA